MLPGEKLRSQRASFLSCTVIGEDALSSGHCHGCPPPSEASVSCQSAAVPLFRKIPMAVTSLFLHSPVLSHEPLALADFPSHVSTSFSCSGTTPSPERKHKAAGVLILSTNQQENYKWTIAVHIILSVHTYTLKGWTLIFLFE